MKISNRIAVSIALSLILVGVVIFNVHSTSGSIFMNGTLSAKHQALKSDCKKCHGPWEGAANSLCESCHKGHAHQKAAPAANAPHAADGSDPRKAIWKCSKCHHEHTGANGIRATDASLCSKCHREGHPKKPAPVAAQPKPTIVFSHEIHQELTPFKKNVGCDSCHKKDAASGRFVTTVKFYDACGWCHTVENHDVKAANKKECAYCHAEPNYKVAWKVGGGLGGMAFSHNRHSTDRCADCHQYGPAETGTEPPKVKPDTAAGYEKKCADCHQQKMVSSSCGTCHSYHTVKS